MGFFKRNIVMIVMFPVIVGGHYGWYKLQENDALVKPEERERLAVAMKVKDLFSLNHVKESMSETREELLTKAK